MKKNSFRFLLTLLVCCSIACIMSSLGPSESTPVPTSSGSVILPPTAIARTLVANSESEPGSNSNSELTPEDFPTTETSLISHDTIFLEDTFDDSSSGWPNTITEDWTGIYENNEYRMVAENGFSYMESWKSETSLQNYSIESDIRFIDQSIENTGCLLIRYSGFNKFYSFCLRPDGSYNFVRYFFNQIDFLLGDPWPIAGVFKSGGDSNHLKAIVNFSEFTLVLNNTYLVSVHNIDYVGGFVGYSVNRFNNSSRSEVIFDNFKISGPAQDLNKPAPYQPYLIQFNDLFDNPFSGWPQLNNGSTSLGYRDNYYNITTSKKLTIATPNRTANQPVLGTYVTPQNLPPDVEVYYGVLCGLWYDYASSLLNGYGGAISNFGNYGIFSLKGTEINPLTIENDPLVSNNGSMVQVQIICLHDTIHLATGLGAVKNLSVQVNVVPFGEIGAFVYMPENTSEVSINFNQVYLEKYSPPDE